MQKDAEKVHLRLAITTPPVVKIGVFPRMWFFAFEGLRNDHPTLSAGRATALCRRGNHYAWGGNS